MDIGNVIRTITQVGAQVLFTQDSTGNVVVVIKCPPIGHIIGVDYTHYFGEGYGKTPEEALLMVLTRIVSLHINGIVDRIEASQPPT